jgi:hypothetical protein
VTRRERRDLLTEPVPDQVRTGFGRVLLGLLVVFGAAVPVGMFAPRYATLAWAVIIPAAAGRGPAHQLAILAAQRDLAVSQALERDNAKLRMERDLLKEPRPSGSRRRRHRDALPLRRCQKAAGFPSLSSCAGEVGA